jgi:hypothetical protein
VIARSRHWLISLALSPVRTIPQSYMIYHQRNPSHAEILSPIDSALVHVPQSINLTNPDEMALIASILSLTQRRLSSGPKTKEKAKQFPAKKDHGAALPTLQIQYGILPATSALQKAT